MTERLLMAALCFWLGWPESVKPPLTPFQLQVKAKEKSKSEVCKKKKKSNTVKALCKRWNKQQEVL